MKPEHANKHHHAPFRMKALLSRLRQWKDITGLRSRIFLVLLLFTLIMLVMLWLQQVAYLDKSYENIKTAQIQRSGDELAGRLLVNNINIQGRVKEISQTQQTCVSIYEVIRSSSGPMVLTKLYHADILPNCVIHHMGESEYRYFYEKSVENGVYTERFTQTVFGTLEVSDQVKESTWWQRFTAGGVGLPDSLVYSRIVNDQDHTYLILLNSAIEPVNATVSVLRIQLLSITGVMLIMAVFFSSVIARTLSSPILLINNKAKRLATGDFSVRFEGKGYRETIQLADTLNYAASELAKTNRLQKDLIANVSHDLRTPLTMISGYAEYMRDFPDEDHSESLQVIEEESRRLVRLIKDVLDSSRLSSGVEELAEAHFPFTEVLRESIAHHNVLLEQSGIQIELTAEQSVILYADEQKLLRAIDNLLSNAVKFVGPSRRVLVTQTVDGELMRLEIKDDGPGIPAEELPYIWDRYYRTDAPDRGRGGSGLGLAIAKGIFNLHKADYGVSSQLGAGSTFWFAMPFAAIDTDDEEEDAESL